MNPGREKMIAEMGIGPTWKLRANSLEQTISAQLMPAMPAINVLSESSSHSDLSGQVETANSLNLVANLDICQTCGWGHTTSKATQVRQAVTSNFLFIHEGDIESESATELASMGAVDQLLMGILRELRIKRGVTAFVANIVKVKPVTVVAGQFNGQKAEISACLSCIKKEIELIRPLVIISFGRVAANSLLGFEAEMAMHDLRGQLHHFDETPLIVTHELSYFLQHPKEKRQLWSDLCLATSAVQII